MRRLILLPAVLLIAASAFTAARPPLVDAARNSNKDSLRALLQKGENVNSAEPDGTTALNWASYRDDLESVDMLIRAGANVNAANDLGATPLWTASQNGSAAVVKRLLDAKADPNLALLSGETPVMVASRSGYPDVVELLLSKGAKSNAKGTRGQTALMWAVAQHHPDVVKVLLAHGADVHQRSDSWTDVQAVEPHGYLPYNKAIPHGADTALLFAARVGDFDSMKQLVAAGANVNDADAWGITVTTLAAHSDLTDMVEFLLDKGANPNLSENGFTALHLAIMYRDEKMASALLAHNADANLTLRSWTPLRRSSDDLHFLPELVGASPLWLAARFSEPNIMRLLLEHGADAQFVHHGDKVSAPRANEGFSHKASVTSVLMAATGMGDGGNSWVQPDRNQREALTLEAVKLAVEHGADLNAADPDGRTALDGAAQMKSVAAYLTEKGAKAGAPAAGGRGGGAAGGRGGGGGGRGGGGGGRGGAGVPPLPAPATPAADPAK